MAVQAPRHLSHGFMVTEGDTVGGPVFLDEFGGCAQAAIVDTTMLGEFPRSDLTMCNYGFLPRKRARVTENQRVVRGPTATQGLLSVDVDVMGRVVGSAAASTSGRVANEATVSGDLLPRLNSHSAEIDAFVTLEVERMRCSLGEVHRRHARALLALAQRAASGRLRAAEAELERALCRNAELEEKALQMAAECQAWMGVARSHEAVATGLRATLDQLLLQSPCAVAGGEGDAEDAQSCCFEAPAANDGGAASGTRAAASSSCKACGGGEACVLLLPCRHLCLCSAWEPAVHACPVCANAKNASLHVLLS